MYRETHLSQSLGHSRPLRLPSVLKPGQVMANLWNLPGMRKGLNSKGITVFPNQMFRSMRVQLAVIGLPASASLGLPKPQIVIDLKPVFPS